MLALGGLAGCKPASQRAAAAVARADALVAAGDTDGAMGALGSATDLDPDNVDAWVRLGRLQLQAGDATGADRSFQRAQELAPDNIEALDNLVILSVRGNELDRAKRYMDSLLVLQPDDPAGLLAQGAIALREHRPADALAASDHVAITYADLPEGAIMHAQAVAALGRRGEAIRGLEQWVKDHADVPQRKAVLALLLDDYRAEGDVAGIRSTAQRLHALDPDEPRYAIESARALRAQGQADQADQVIAALLAAHPHAPDVARAVLAFWGDALTPAEARGRAVTLAQRSERPIRIALANGLLNLGAPADALALVVPLIGPAITPANVDATAVQVRALVALGRTSEARKRADQLLAFDGANVPGLLVRARLFLNARAFDRAIADAQLAQSSDGGSEEAAALLARIYATQGNLPLAQQTYALAVQSFPDSYPLAATYADWLVANGRRPEAVRVLGSFARRHRRYAPAWRRYAALCQSEGAPCATETPGDQR